MLQLTLLLLALQAPPKVEGALAAGPDGVLTLTGSAEVPDGLAFNLELFLEGRKEALAQKLVQVKGGSFTGSFDTFKSAGRVFPGRYHARINYHPGFTPRPLPGVDRFHVDVPLQVGTPDEATKAHQAARDRLAADLRAFGGVGDEVREAFEKAKGKPAPAEWQKLADGWKARILELERRASRDPEYHALGYIGLTTAGTEHLREKVRGLVEHGGAGREAELQTGHESLKSTIRGMVLEMAPAGSTTAERRTLIGQARGALVAALDAEGPAFAGCRRGYTEALLKLTVKAPPGSLDRLQSAIADGADFFERADADRAAGRKLLPALDKKLDDLLQALTKTE